MVLSLFGIFYMDFIAAMIYAPVFAGKLTFLRLIPHDSISLFLAFLHIRIGFLELSSALWIARCDFDRVGIRDYSFLRSINCFFLWVKLFFQYRCFILVHWYLLTWARISTKRLDNLNLPTEVLLPTAPWFPSPYSTSRYCSGVFSPCCTPAPDKTSFTRCLSSWYVGETCCDCVHRRPMS
jgi:hypothetical protein